MRMQRPSCVSETVEAALARLSTQMDNVMEALGLVREDVRSMHSRYNRDIGERSEGERELDRRVSRVEYQLRIVEWGGGVLATVVVALVVAWLKGVLGL